MWIGHRKEIRKMTFQALALCRSEIQRLFLSVTQRREYADIAWQRKRQNWTNPGKALYLNFIVGHKCITW